MKLFELAEPGDLRDTLVKAVLAGEKTATTSLLTSWDKDEPFPKVGDKQQLVDSVDKPVGIIEITELFQCRLADIDISIANDEGEKFLSVAQWREAHEEFWKPEIVTDDTVVVVEKFKLT